MSIDTRCSSTVGFQSRDTFGHQAVVLCKLRVFHLQAPAENFKIQKIRKKSKSNGIYYNSKWEHFCLLFNILHSLHESFVLCTMMMYASSLQHK